MLRNGAREWARARGFAIDVASGELEGSDGGRLDLRVGTDAEAVACTITIPSWEDVILDHWPNGEFALRRVALHNLVAMLRAGTLGWLWNWSRPTLVIAALPSVTTFVQLLLFAAVVALAGAAVASAINPVMAGAAIAPFAALAIVLRRFERANHWDWAARFTGFAVASAQGDPWRRKHRLEPFVRLLQRVSRSGADEVVLVAHSGGVQVAVAVLAEYMRRSPPDVEVPLLLSLGSLLPLVSRGPTARAVRADLLELASRPDLRWIDISSPPDPAAIATVDPVEATFGKRSHGYLSGARTYNARFHATIRPALFERAKRDRLLMHFLYLKPARADIRSDDYDLYGMLLSPEAADGRFAERPSAPAYFGRGRDHHPAAGFAPTRRRPNMVNGSFTLDC